MDKGIESGIRIELWDALAAHLPASPKRQGAQRTLPSSFLGAFSALGIHIVAAIALFGSGSHASVVKPDPSPRSLTALYLISLPGSDTAGAPTPNFVAKNSLLISAHPLRVDLPQVDIPPDPENDNAGDSLTPSDELVKRAHLVGIYSGQIRARIERIWSRPRTPVNDNGIQSKSGDSAEYFHCEAQIVQDSIGNVQEVLLPNCNGSIGWQNSLVVAIRQASPLPAPPSPKVFSGTITLTFDSSPYVLGEPDEGYEPMTRATATNRSPEQIRHEIMPLINPVDQ